jgi:hypothetical protein
MHGMDKRTKVSAVTYVMAMLLLLALMIYCFYRLGVI